MLLLPYCSILLIIFPQLIITEARIWNVILCFREKHNSVRISLDKVKYVNITSEKEQNCFKTEFELDNAIKPSFLEFGLRPIKRKNINEAIAVNYDLPELYYGDCSDNSCNGTMITLEKMAYWTVEVTRSHIHDDFKGSLATQYGSLVNITFGRNSRKSNASIHLPASYNHRSSFLVIPSGKFWLDKKVKMKNMETSEIYSCIFLDLVVRVHRCFLTNDSIWKIELTSQSRLAQPLHILFASVGVTGSEKNTSQTVRFIKLAYHPTVSSVMNIPNKNISEVEIVFKNTEKTFHLSKIVMTKLLTGEEYGCVNVHGINAEKYTCKVLKAKNWLLKIISPEEHGRNFSVEIIQDTLSSFTRYLTWDYFSTYGNSYIKYFNLKTYEDEEITNLNLHFHNKSLRIDEISLIRNYTEYKFKRNEDSNTHNSLVTGFSLTTKEEINSNKTIVLNKTEKMNSNSNETIPIMEIVIGLLSVIILLLLVLLVRSKILGNNKGKGNMSEPQVTSSSMQKNNSVYINAPGQELHFQQQDSERHYECMNPDPEISAAIEDESATYMELK